MGFSHHRTISELVQNRTRPYIHMYSYLFQVVQRFVGTDQNVFI